MRSTGCASPYELRWWAVIGALRSPLFRCEVVSREVRFWSCSLVVRWCSGLLLCFLIVGIHASGISIPLSLLMLSGWGLMWIASLTLRAYQCESQSINFTSFQSGWLSVSLACSETASCRAYQRLSTKRKISPKYWKTAKTMARGGVPSTPLPLVLRWGCDFACTS